MRAPAQEGGGKRRGALVRTWVFTIKLQNEKIEVSSSNTNEYLCLEETQFEIQNGQNIYLILT